MNTPVWTPWTLTIEDYVGPADVKPHTYPEYSPKEFSVSRPSRSYSAVHVPPRLPDYEIHTMADRSFHIRHIPTDTWVGSDLFDVVHIAPAHQGIGLMAEVYLALDARNMPQLPRHGPNQGIRQLTPASLKALCHAHALHVHDAFKRNETLPMDVIKQYTQRPGGGIQLKTPYDADACNAHLEALKAAFFAGRPDQDTTLAP